jgi:hypothetical protein
MCNEYPKTILLSEAGNSWGCHWSTEAEPQKINYGFSGLPPESSLWLACAEGSAVEQILELGGIAEVVSTRKGAYGGKKRTVRVDVQKLEDACTRYWENVNEKGRREGECSRSCHYCGGRPVIGTGFFGEPICEQCR